MRFKFRGLGVACMYHDTLWSVVSDVQQDKATKLEYVKGPPVIRTGAVGRAAA